MDIQTFIQNFREAFGKNAELPLVFWYSDEQKGETEKINGCFFKGMRRWYYQPECRKHRLWRR